LTAHTSTDEKKRRSSAEGATHPRAAMKRKDQETLDAFEAKHAMTRASGERSNEARHDAEQFTGVVSSLLRLKDKLHSSF
jgi:hypothetical protein